jgi:hypothetical protein
MATTLLRHGCKTSEKEVANRSMLPDATTTQTSILCRGNQIRGRPPPNNKGPDGVDSSSGPASSWLIRRSRARTTNWDLADGSCAGTRAKPQVSALGLLASESCCRNYCGRTADGLLAQGPPVALLHTKPTKGRPRRLPTQPRGMGRTYEMREFRPRAHQLFAKSSNRPRRQR